MNELYQKERLRIEKEVNKWVELNKKTQIEKIQKICIENLKIDGKNRKRIEEWRKDLKINWENQIQKDEIINEMENKIKKEILINQRSHFFKTKNKKQK